MNERADAPSAAAGKPAVRKQRKTKRSPVEELSAEDMQSLRLDEGARADFDALVARFGESRLAVQAFESEDVASMDDGRFDAMTGAEGKHAANATAIVHFLAPRILKMRDSAAKRKWRSFVTKFRKDEKLR